MSDKRHQLKPHHPFRRWNDPGPTRVLWNLRGISSGAIYTAWRNGKLKKQILSMTLGARTFAILLDDDSPVARTYGKATW